MKKFAFILFISVVTISCNNNKNQKSDEIKSSTEYVDINGVKTFVETLGKKGEQIKAI